MRSGVEGEIDEIRDAISEQTGITAAPGNSVILISAVLIMCRYMYIYREKERATKNISMC